MNYNVFNMYIGRIWHSGTNANGVMFRVCTALNSGFLGSNPDGETFFFCLVIFFLVIFTQN